MENKTVFVIGAGASNEAKLPTGFELKDRITNLLNMQFDFNRQKSGDHLIVAALRELVRLDDGRNGDINPHLHEAWHIRDALSQAISIDNFIDSQRGNEKIAICGKLGIVRAILDAERKSLLYFDRFDRNPGLNFSKLGATWYVPFFQLLTENCQLEDLAERVKNVVAIIFNYDRCFEHYLFNAFQNYYRISADESASIVKSISIYHPYGSVGTLPWAGSKGAIEFGAEPNQTQLLALANEIKTFAEGTDPDSSDIADIKSHMSDADKLVFIGFAFHKLNMDLISLEVRKNKTDKSPDCYATTFGISESDKEVVSQQMSKLYGVSINSRMVNLKCREFFEEFWRSLSF